MKAQALKSVRELESQLGEVVEDLEAEKEVNTVLSIYLYPSIYIYCSSISERLLRTSIVLSVNPFIYLSVHLAQKGLSILSLYQSSIIYI